MYISVFVKNGRSGGIRTHDPLTPSQVRYLAALRSEPGLALDHGLLERRIRAQGNFIEYVPLAVILCGLAEYRGAGSAWVWTIAGLLILGRAAHAAGMLSGVLPLRALGMLGTYGSLLIGAAALTFG